MRVYVTKVSKSIYFQELKQENLLNLMWFRTEAKRINNGNNFFGNSPPHPQPRIPCKVYQQKSTLEISKYKIEFRVALPYHLPVNSCWKWALFVFFFFWKHYWEVCLLLNIHFFTNNVTDIQSHLLLLFIFSKDYYFWKYFSLCSLVYFTLLCTNYIYRYIKSVILIN